MQHRPLYSNRYSNPVNFGGVRDCSPMCSKRFDQPKLDTHTRVRTPIIQLGVKWSQVQILSARPRKPALTSAGAGFMLLEFLADVWQWASSVPSGREWADA